MALEQWALERLDAGEAFEAVFEDVIKGSNSVAMLGIGVSLSLVDPAKSVPNSLPLITCQHLWRWDIPRLVQDSTSMFANEIGDWFRHRHLLQAVRNLNQRPHRRQDVRALVPFYVFSADRRLAGRYARAIRSFPERLPFEVQEQKDDPESVAGLLKQAEVSAQQGDPDNWRVAPTEDGQNFQLWSEPPYLEEGEHKQYVAASAARERILAVSLWAHSTLEKAAVGESMAISEGLARARELDVPELFDCVDGDDMFGGRSSAAAVAGAAFVAARHLSEAEWSPENGHWCLDVFERAATAPEPEDGLGGRYSHQSMSPVVFAVHGYSALLARGFEADKCRAALLNLALDPIEDVASAVFKSATYYASSEPHFLAVLFDLGLRACLYEDGDYPERDDLAWSSAEADRQMALLAVAERYLAEDQYPAAVDIPPPWLPMAPGAADQDQFTRNPIRFDYRHAQRAVLQLPISSLVADERFVDQLVDVAGQLLGYTAHQITPPFANSRREHRGGNTPFEWIHAFSNWCGRLCAHLPESTVNERFLVGIFALEHETGLLIMESFMVSFMIEAFLRPDEISKRNMALWDRITGWTFDHPEWGDGASDRHLDREYQSCAFATLFCVTRDFSPLICGVDPGWTPLHRFRPIVERAIRQFGRHQTLFLAVGKFLERGGRDLLPEPALDWLREIAIALKGDQDFWEANGDLMVDVLKQVIGTSAPLSREHRDRVLLIADILVDNGVRGAGFLQQELHRLASA